MKYPWYKRTSEQDKKRAQVHDLLVNADEDLVMDAILSLTKEEADVILLRMGVLNCRLTKVNEISTLLNLTLNIVYDLERKAMYKLLHPSRCNPLTLSSYQNISPLDMI